MSDERNFQQRQDWYVYGDPVPAPPAVPSTRMLTVTKWITVGVVGLSIWQLILSIMRGYSNMEGLRGTAAWVTGANSTNAQELNWLGETVAEDIAWLEFLIVLEWATLAAIVLIWIFAVLAGFGQSWARVVCAVLMIFPVALISFDAIESSVLWELILLVPFLALVALWWPPGTSRGLRAVAGHGGVA